MCSICGLDREVASSAITMAAQPRAPGHRALAMQQMVLGCVRGAGAFKTHRIPNSSPDTRDQSVWYSCAVLLPVLAILSSAAFVDTERAIEQ